MNFLIKQKKVTMTKIGLGSSSSLIITQTKDDITNMGLRLKCILVIKTKTISKMGDKMNMGSTNNTPFTWYFYGDILTM